jgi:archaellum component FlaC
MSNWTKIISWWSLFLLAALIILAAAFLRTASPCQEPLTYRIGIVDERFGLTRQEFASAVDMAAAMWGKPLSHELFREDHNGTIEINLVYDYRQEATDNLKKLNFKINNTKDSYEELKSRSESLKSEYEQKNAALRVSFSAYNTRVDAFNAENKSWSRRGGAPESVYKRLTSEKNDLNSLREKLQTQQDELKKLADTINSLVIVINEIATNYNLDLGNHRNTGNILGHEFCEGFYEYKNGKQSITIYQFDNDYRLVRVLAHEFGHALGLKHSEDQKAVMYRLIQADIIELSVDDITSLKARCNIH